MMTEVVTFTVPILAVSCSDLHLSHANILKDQISSAPVKCPAEGEMSYMTSLKSGLYALDMVSLAAVGTHTL